jgi:hypothetical protein
MLISFRKFHTQAQSAFFVTEVKEIVTFNPLNAELNPICHLLAVLGAHHIFHVSRIRVNEEFGRKDKYQKQPCIILKYYRNICGPGSSVGIATDYGLDGPGSNPGADEIFRPSRPALGPTSSTVKGTQ